METSTPPRPLVVTRHAALLDDLLRLAAAAGVETEATGEPELARRSWATAPVVLVGADLAAATLRAGLPHRPGVVLVGTDLDDAGIWETAVRIGAAHVSFLPDGEPWLGDLLADATEPPGPPATVVAVAGGRGGAGATCLAVALALAGVRGGSRTLLLDADPLGAGIDLTLGAEDATGLRWPDLTSSRGRVPRRALSDALPRVDGLDVLSWDRDDPAGVAVPPEAVASLLDAACRGHDLVVADLPRHVDPAADVLLHHATLTLLVVPAEIRAVASAARTGAGLTMRSADVRVVVRGPAPGGLTADTVASALGLPLAGELRAEPGLAEALERGEAPGTRPRGPLARFCTTVLRQLDVTAGRAAA